MSRLVRPAGGERGARIVRPGGLLRSAPLIRYLEWSEQPQRVLAGESIPPPPAVRVMRARGDAEAVPDTSFATPISVSLVDPRGAVLGGETLRAPESGVAALSGLSVDLHNTGYRLHAEATDDLTADSDPFAVTCADTFDDAIMLGNPNWGFDRSGGSYDADVCLYYPWSVTFDIHYSDSRFTGYSIVGGQAAEYYINDREDQGIRIRRNYPDQPQVYIAGQLCGPSPFSGAVTITSTDGVNATVSFAGYSRTINVPEQDGFQPRISYISHGFYADDVDDFVWVSAFSGYGA